MSGSINNNVVINSNSNDYNINDKQKINDKANLTKTLESGGITNISYTNQGVKGVGNKETNEQAMAALLSQDPEVTEKMLMELCSSLSKDALKATAKESLGIMNSLTIYAKDNVKTTDTQTNTTASSTDLTSLMGNFSNFDIRELMKLLIQAFAQFFATQRDLDLLAISEIQTAMENKISAMEKEKDETYKSAMAQAIGSIVSGCMSVCAGLCSVVAGVINIKGGIKGSKILSGESKSANAKVNINNTDVKAAAAERNNQLQAMANATMKEYEGWATVTNALGQMIGGLGGIASGVAGIESAEYSRTAKEAQIEQTTQDATLEILKKMQQEGSEQTKQLMDFITRILSMIQELQQAAAQTEKTIVQA